MHDDDAQAAEDFYRNQEQYLTDVTCATFFGLGCLAGAALLKVYYCIGDLEKFLCCAFFCLLGTLRKPSFIRVAACMSFGMTLGLGVSLFVNYLSVGRQCTLDMPQPTF